MARVTSKLQVTIPKAIAERYGIEPGEDIEWLPAGEAIRVVPHAGAQQAADHTRRLELFDRASERQRNREAERDRQPRATAGGGARSSTAVAALVDTSVLVYRFDQRFPDKQRIATDLLRSGIGDGSIYVSHQSIVEFVAAVTRTTSDGLALLEPVDAVGRLRSFSASSMSCIRTPSFCGLRYAERPRTSFRGSTPTCGPTGSASASLSCSRKSFSTTASTAPST